MEHSPVERINKYFQTTPVVRHVIKVAVLSNAQFLIAQGVFITMAMIRVVRNVAADTKDRLFLKVKTNQQIILLGKKIDRLFLKFNKIDRSFLKVKRTQ